MHCCFTGCKEFKKCGHCIHDFCSCHLNQIDVASISPLTLEEQVNRRWGSSMFDWTIGRCIHLDKEQWFWYCGTSDIDKSKWKHQGLSDTINEALIAMINV